MFCMVLTSAFLHEVAAVKPMHLYSVAQASIVQDNGPSEF